MSVKKHNLKKKDDTSISTSLRLLQRETRVMVKSRNQCSSLRQCVLGKKKKKITLHSSCSEWPLPFSFVEAVIPFVCPELAFDAFNFIISLNAARVVTERRISVQSRL